MLAAHRVPDHTTNARFRQRQQARWPASSASPWAVADAGLVCADVLAVDGTKIHANLSERATRDYERLAREVLADAEEDERFGDQRGDELPESLGTPEDRAKWLADAKRRLEERRAQDARPIPASRPARLREPSPGSKRSTVSKSRPRRSTELWAVQEPLDFPGAVYGLTRDAAAHDRMIRQSAWFGAHQDDHIV